MATDADLAGLAEDVRVKGTDAPFGAYCFWPDEPGAALGRSTEARVFLEAFGNTPELLEREYGPYEDRSLYVVVLDHLRRRPAGVMRLITGRPRVSSLNELGLKSLDDLVPHYREDPETVLGRAEGAFPVAHTWDLATLAVDADYRSAAATGLVALGLYQSVVRLANASGVRRLIAILDLVVWRMTETRFGAPFVPLAPPAPYLGSPASLPVYCDLGEWRGRLEAKDPTLHAVIYDGRGIEPALEPLVLRPVLEALRDKARAQRAARTGPRSPAGVEPSAASTAGRASDGVGRAK